MIVNDLSSRTFNRGDTDMHTTEYVARFSTIQMQCSVNSQGKWIMRMNFFVSNVKRFS